MLLELIAEDAGELDVQNVFDGGDDGILTLALAQPPQKVQMVVEQLFQAGENAIDDVRRYVKLSTHPFRENLK